MWLEANKGFNIDEAASVMVAIRDIITAQTSGHLQGFATQAPTEWTLLPDFSFTLEQVTARSGLAADKVAAIVDAFTSPEGDPQLKMADSSSYNKAASHPLILLKDGARLAFLEYNLFECLYDDPFSWIGLDKNILENIRKPEGLLLRSLPSAP